VLCSNCSNHIEPVIALDIDGTLGDYHSHFLRFTAAYLGGDEPTLNLLRGSTPVYGGVEPFREYCCRTFDITVDVFRDIKLAYRQGAQKRSMPNLPGASVAYWQLHRSAEIWLTTTRP